MLSLYFLRVSETTNFIGDSGEIIIKEPSHRKLKTASYVTNVFE